MSFIYREWDRIQETVITAKAGGGRGKKRNQGTRDRGADPLE